jgi:hypothetical protein
MENVKELVLRILGNNLVVHAKETFFGINADGTLFK